MPILYAAADIFMNTSLWEGFNLPLAEAQFQKTPVVALNVCDHPEIVVDGYSGFLVDSMSEIKSKILELAKNSDLRKVTAKNAGRHISQFTWDRNVDKLHTLIQDCVKVAGQTTQSQPQKAHLNKSVGYYFDYGQYLVQRFGWKTLFRESLGWVKRRLR